jgi:hypothetical protein
MPSFHIKHRKKSSGKEKGEYEIKEIFIGHHTIFSMMGFIVGGILIGRSIWQYSSDSLGLPLTILLGIFIFTVSGYFSGQFNK